MQSMISPIKISIRGNFWDCQAYGENLYLWNLENELITIKWEEIIKNITTDSKYDFFLKCAFYDSRFPYNLKYHSADKNLELRNALISQFNELSSKTIELDLIDIPHTKRQSPFSEPPTDTEIMNSRFYGATFDGLFTANLSESKTKKVWDCALLSITGNGIRNGRMALSAGSEGLFQLGIGENTEYNLTNIIEKKNNIYQISSNHSLFSNWLNNHVYSSSSIEESIFSKFKVTSKKENLVKKKTIELEETIDSSKIFKDGTKKLSWGSGNKIYKISGAKLSMVNFNNNISSNFTSETTSQLPNLSGEVLKGGVSYFGTIIELDDSLLILRSDDIIESIPGPIGKWRVYPRSLKYQNHLHTILEDHIKIYSFNHDFLVDQNKKFFGIKQDYDFKNTKNSLFA